MQDASGRQWWMLQRRWCCATNGRSVFPGEPTCTQHKSHWADEQALVPRGKSGESVVSRGRVDSPPKAPPRPRWHRRVPLRNMHDQEGRGGSSGARALHG